MKGKYIMLPLEDYLSLCKAANCVIKMYTKEKRKKGRKLTNIIHCNGQGDDKTSLLGEEKGSTPFVVGPIKSNLEE